MSTNWHWKRDAEDIAWLHVHTAGHGPNVLSKDCLAKLDATLEELAKARPAAVIIMSDKENGFFAGANVEEFTRIKLPVDAEQHIRWVHGILARLESLRCPPLALIHGFCLGAGLELASACRYRIARSDEATRIGFPEVRLGIFPGYDGTVRATRLLGPHRALPLLLSGRTLDARAARRLGLVDQAVPERQLRAALPRRWSSGTRRR